MISKSIAFEAAMQVALTAGLVVAVEKDGETKFVLTEKGKLYAAKKDKKRG